MIRLKCSQCEKRFAIETTPADGAVECPHCQCVLRLKKPKSPPSLDEDARMRPEDLPADDDDASDEEDVEASPRPRRKKKRRLKSETDEFAFLEKFPYGAAAVGFALVVGMILTSLGFLHHPGWFDFMWFYGVFVFGISFLFFIGVVIRLAPGHCLPLVILVALGLKISILFLAIAALYELGFTIYHWKEAWKPYVLHVFGALIFMTGLVLSIKMQIVEQRPENFRLTERRRPPGGPPLDNSTHFDKWNRFGHSDIPAVMR
jgi:DNA-directed RNA polymerase subunit RPC12/RpoP